MLVLALALAWPVVASAQKRPALEVVAPTIGATGATVTASNLFADGDMRDLVRSGFPAQLRYRVELWRAGGLFDDLEGLVAWEVVIQYDAPAQRYNVLRRQGGKVEDAGTFATLTTARTELERPVRTALVPERPGSRYYYTFTLEIEALSVSDMNQLERWLRGVKGNTAAGAVGSGLRTLMLRMLGGEKQRYLARTGMFTAP